jgi:hypothetical protein
MKVKIFFTIWNDENTLEGIQVQTRGHTDCLHLPTNVGRFVFGGIHNSTCTSFQGHQVCAWQEWIQPDVIGEGGGYLSGFGHGSGCDR